MPRRLRRRRRHHPHARLRPRGDDHPGQPGRPAGARAGCSAASAAAAAAMVAPLPRRSIARDRLAAQCRELAANLRSRVAGHPTTAARRHPGAPGARGAGGLVVATAHPDRGPDRARRPARHPRSGDAHLPAPARPTPTSRRATSATTASPSSAPTPSTPRPPPSPTAAPSTSTPVQRGPRRAAPARWSRRSPSGRPRPGRWSRRPPPPRCGCGSSPPSARWPRPRPPPGWGNRPDSAVQLDVEVDIPEGGPAAFWRRARHTLAFHLRWQSTRFRNSLRAGVALTASLLLARWVDFDHAFWVVLGTLMVLRSGVNDTAATALQALRGTLIGFAVAAPLAYAAERPRHPAVGACCRSWCSCRRGRRGPIGLGSGQAAFTIFVVVLFNLAAPAGAQTAVLRLETVATGIVVAVVAGFVFWPRGPQASLGPIAGRLYRASAATIRCRERRHPRPRRRPRRPGPGPPRAGRRPRAARGDAAGARRRPPRRRRRHRPGGDHDPAVDRAGRRLGPQRPRPRHHRPGRGPTGVPARRSSRPRRSRWPPGSTRWPRRSSTPTAPPLAPRPRRPDGRGGAVGRGAQPGGVPAPGVAVDLAHDRRRLVARHRRRDRGDGAGPAHAAGGAEPPADLRCRRGCRRPRGR